MREPALFRWQAGPPAPHVAYVLPRLIELLPRDPKTIYDVGCGNGHLTAEFARLGHHVVGVDSSDEGIKLARSLYPSIPFETLSAYELSRRFSPKSAHIIVASEVIEHLTQPKLFLQSIYETLKPGGMILITTPYHGYLKNLALSLLGAWDRHFSVEWEGGHIKFFSEKTLAEMAKAAGFENLSFHNAGRLPYLWKSMVMRAYRRNSLK